MKKALLLAWGLALLAGVACGGGDGGEVAGNGAATPGNLFQNPGFEEGSGPWFSLTTEAWGASFEVTDEVAHSGGYSSFLLMQAAPEDEGTRVFGVVQEVSPKEFPELVSGYYRVEDWRRGTPKQYLQFVVIAIGDTNLPGGYPNHQIRYLLAGIDAPPFDIANAKFVYVDTAEPVTGRWVYFERNIKQDFEAEWGAAPENFQTLRLLFEVRYDDKASGSGEVSGAVHYDDLYIGPAGGNPNRREG